MAKQMTIDKMYARIDAIDEELSLEYKGCGETVWTNNLEYERKTLGHQICELEEQKPKQVHVQTALCAAGATA